MSGESTGAPQDDDQGGERSPEILRSYASSEEAAAARRLLEEPDAELGGLWGASLAFFLAATKDAGGAAAPGADLVVTATQEEAEELAEELSLFSSLPVRLFPAWESLLIAGEGGGEAGRAGGEAGRGGGEDGEIYRQRLEVVARLVEGLGGSGAAEPAFIVAPVQALIQPVPAPGALPSARLRLEKGKDYAAGDLASRLVAAGFRHVPLVGARGEFSTRGDILDLFPYQGEHPLRLELFGDTLDSLRFFHAESQRSVAGSAIESVDVFLLSRKDVFRDSLRGPDDVLITDLLGAHGRVFLKEPDAVAERAGKILHNLAGEEAESRLRELQRRLESRSRARVRALPAGTGARSLDLRFHSVERYQKRDLSETLRALSERVEAGCHVEIYCENPAEANRFREILADHGLGAAPRVAVRCGPLRRGFEVGAVEVIFLTTRELFHRTVVRRVLKGRAPPSRAIESFVDLSKGDHVVHLAHGVARYLGMECFEKDNVLQEFLVLEFRGQLKLYVPVSKADLVQKYIGPGDRAPVLDRVGGSSWSRKKEEVEEALLDLASELIEVQAMREERPGFAAPLDSEWQRQFEAAFPFEDTPDQVEVTAAIKADMQSPRPMDRLICGDVGYGKTELAMRAAFKAVDAGKQVAMLVPTTVLAQQHFHTFKERMAEFPVTIDVISRFRTASEQKRVVEAARAGQLDVLIGTHRILSRDIGFRDLGLVIIDEEQRFGVEHKERLKKLRSTVDVLTLSATPIPRTLHMALLGIRDISSLTTAPQGRSPVATEVCRYEPGLVREAVIRELNRDGQVYFVHNRIHDIARVKMELEQLVPEARIEYAHGQMNEHELEDKMVRFVLGEIDVLISTTIIESGIDIPNVNTIFIDEADIYGLADLHQLRGRVGRYKHQAYCYLVLPAHRPVNEDAEKRLRALVEFSDLGAGFQIALRDLEIRGAGNILGPAQSGHIALVGYDMYCRLLEKAVRRLKQEEGAEPLQVEVDLALEAFIPEQFMAREKERLEVYRRLSQAQGKEALADLAAELEDRFGPLPAPLTQLLEVQELRVLCAQHGIEYLGREGEHLILRGREPMSRLLEGSPVRVAVLDARTRAVSLAAARGGRAGAIGDEHALRTGLAWLASGKFPLAHSGGTRQTAHVEG